MKKSRLNNVFTSGKYVIWNNTSHVEISAPHKYKWTALRYTDESMPFKPYNTTVVPESNLITQIIPKPHYT